MAKFTYLAKNHKGQTSEGILEAQDYSDAVAILRGQNYYPIKIKLQREVAPLRLFKKKVIGIKELAIFCRQFATTLTAGIPVVDSLDILRGQTENQKFKEVITNIYEVIQKGYPLSEAMTPHAKVFPLLLIHMIEVGEISGTLDIVMERMAIHFEKENKINEKVKSAMTYPVVVSTVAFLVVIFLLTFVMPTFIGMFDTMGAQLPLVTRVLLEISESLRKYSYIYLLTMILFTYLLKKCSGSTGGKYTIDKLKLKVPIFGRVIQKVMIARFTRTMATLLSSGIDLLQAIEVIQRVIDNDFVNEKMKEVEKGVEKGVRLSQPIRDTGIFPPMVYQMIKVGEDTGNLDFVLEKAADFYDQEVDTSISQMTTMIEPLIIVFLGGIVGFIVASMILPIFDIYNAIG